MVVKTKIKSSISMLSWAYNEQENITVFLNRAFALLSELTDDYELILINDASTDKTLEIALSFCEDYPQLRIISNKSNMGCGVNAKTAFKNATKDIVFWQTVDWSYNLSNIDQALSFLESYDIDVVLGVRIRHDISKISKLPINSGIFRHIEISKRSDNWKKIVISIVNYAMLRICFKLPLNDFQNVMFFKRNLLQSLLLESESSFLGIECLLKSYWKQAVIKEIPIPFIPRKLGKGNGTRLKSIFKSVGNILKFWFKFMVVKDRQDKGEGIIIPYYVALTPSDVSGLIISKTTGLVTSLDASLREHKLSLTSDRA